MIFQRGAALLLQQEKIEPGWSTVAELGNLLSIECYALIIISLMQRVYWPSGSDYGGKSTVSNALASRFGGNVYHMDELWDSARATFFT